MNNIGYLIKGAGILFLTITLVLTSTIVIAEKETAKTKETIIENVEITNNKNVDLTKIKDQPIYEKMYVLRGRCVGNASTGKKIGFRSTIAIIDFDYMMITKIVFSPIRWEFADFNNVRAILFNVQQTIPQGPFDFEQEWVIAIVFE